MHKIIVSINNKFSFYLFKFIYAILLLRFFCGVGFIKCEAGFIKNENSQVNRFVLDEKYDEINEPISIAIPEKYKKNFKKIIVNTDTYNFSRNQRIESWLKDKEIDIRPPEVILRFIEDLDVLESSQLPGFIQNSDFIYIGFPKFIYDDPIVLWNEIIFALDKVGIHPVRITDNKLGYDTNWKIWNEHNYKLDSCARYRFELTQLDKKPDFIYLKVTLLDGYKYVSLSNQYSEEGDVYALNIADRSRILKKCINKILINIEKYTRDNRRENLVKKYPYITLKLNDNEENFLKENINMGNKQLVIEAPFELVWEVIQFCFKKLNIKIVEKNKSEASFIIEYFPSSNIIKKINNSVKNSDKDYLLDLIPNKYKIQFIDKNDNTELLLYTEESNELIIDGAEIFYEALQYLLYNYIDVISNG